MFLRAGGQEESARELEREPRQTEGSVRNTVCAVREEARALDRGARACNGKRSELPWKRRARPGAGFRCCSVQSTDEVTAFSARHFLSQIQNLHSGPWNFFKPRITTSCNMGTGHSGAAAVMGPLRLDPGCYSLPFPTRSRPFPQLQLQLGLIKCCCSGDEMSVSIIKAAQSLHAVE
ncbi:hypothetical protein NDU88_006390 [Pleurodeles waltl]|uniref:Uncharacterized protein n=1 Tax=Pleurodeles waltl TaxID=8319 RepID=A0AAV7QLU3_PLEWA|nr:hypothetical protein NDU88_006390 [Pleurodeles waltl]